MILPYLEQTALYNKLDLKGGSNNPQGSPHTGLVYTGTNEYNGALLADKALAVYRCPSSPMPLWALTGNTPGAGVMAPSYVGIMGAVDHSSTLDRSGESNPHAGKGLISSGGVLISHQGFKFADITDGSSNTLVVSEQSDFCINSAGASVDCSSDFGHSFSMGPGGAGENRHWNLVSVRYRIGDRVYEKPGVNEDYYPQNRPLLSGHTGGVMGVLGDGTVRFFSNNLDLQTLYNLSNRNDNKVVGDF